MARTLGPRAGLVKHVAALGVLEGERKHVTVLFADLKGSMELLADRDPEDARRLLDAGVGAHDRGHAPLRGHRQPNTTTEVGSGQRPSQSDEVVARTKR